MTYISHFISQFYELSDTEIIGGFINISIAHRKNIRSQTIWFPCGISDAC